MSVVGEIEGNRQGNCGVGMRKTLRNHVKSGNHFYSYTFPISRTTLLPCFLGLSE